MVCSISDNNPLSKLQLDLGLPSQCHSLRPHCIQGYETRRGNYALGLPGTALGYCQALFKYAGDPELHTRKVTRLLTEIGAPWAYSHELFWGHRHFEHPDDFLERSIKPLQGTGRVPVLITSLDPARQSEEIQHILGTNPSIQPGETILVRMVLSEDESLYHAAALIKNLIATSKDNEVMPKWWPLFQGEISVEKWGVLKKTLDRDWRYVNIAINPFVENSVFEFIHEQITVAQIPIGFAEGISADGLIQIAADMKIMGAKEGASYLLPDFVHRLKSLTSPPTIIVLGPSLSEWNDELNQTRLSKLLPLLNSSCNTLWADLPKARRDAIWGMRA